MYSECDLSILLRARKMMFGGAGARQMRYVSLISSNTEFNAPFVCLMLILLHLSKLVDRVNGKERSE